MKYNDPCPADGPTCPGCGACDTEIADRIRAELAAQPEGYEEYPFEVTGDGRILWDKDGRMFEVEPEVLYRVLEAASSRRRGVAQ